jgi:putative phosphoesterase
MSLGAESTDMSLAIISDTHVPGRSSGVPEWVLDEVRDADHVIHAGDLTDEATLVRVQDLASELTAVSGNMDGALGLPTAAKVDYHGVPIVVTHGTGPAAGYERRVLRAVREFAGDGADGTAPPNAVGVAGHTHEVLDTTVDGVRLLNPGSATGADPADRTTMMTATVVDGELEVTLQDG